MKNRLILDCRISGSNDKTTKSERIILPRIWDLIKDALALANQLTSGEELSLLVCDFTDAFYMVPLGIDEQRYFSAYHRGRWYVWTRVAQGSLNGPNIFGRLSALVGRLSQSCFHPHELRLHIYADDPCAVLRGTQNKRDRMTAILLWIWLALGFGLALHKGQYGSKVTWIGYSITLHSDRVVASIKEGFLKDFSDFTKQLRKTNLISKRDLRKYAGQANHITGMLFV